MIFQEQQKKLVNRIISSMCKIKDYPYELLLHTVFVEEVQKHGDPVYNKYPLIAIQLLNDINYSVHSKTNRL